MKDVARAGIDNLPPSLARRVDEACIRFERACKGQQTPRIEDYLDEVAEPERSALFHELLRVELAYCNRRGEKLSREGYQRRFPKAASPHPKRS